MNTVKLTIITEYVPDYDRINWIVEHGTGINIVGSEHISKVLKAREQTCCYWVDIKK